jgi:hypothetical protein
MSAKLWLIIVVSIIWLIPAEASAAWKWPWEARPLHHSRVHHRAVRRYYRPIEHSSPVDCARINEAVNALDVERLSRALCLSTNKQRETILKCSEKGREAILECSKK